jgi:NitT/TauT family transport system substrate-binding protein
MIRRLLLTLPVIFSGIVLSAQLPKIVFTPHWLPQAQFAGYYVAHEKGFYNHEGIDVEIAHPSASVMATERLRNGESDIISLFLITALALKNPDLDLVNIAQWSQNSALLFVTKKESGLSKLSDLNGKKIGIWESGFDEVPKALVHSNNYSVTWVPILSTINLFMLGGIDAMTVMWYNEYDQLINAGINPDELNTFFFSDYGYNIPEDGLYCLNKTVQMRSDDLRKFMIATQKGWEYAKANKQEALDIVLTLMKKEFIPTNLAHQRWMLEKVLEQMEPGSKNVKTGELAEPDFHKTLGILIDGGYLKEKVGFGEFYKPIQ